MTNDVQVLILCLSYFITSVKAKIAHCAYVQLLDFSFVCCFCVNGSIAKLWHNGVEGVLKELFHFCPNVFSRDFFLIFKLLFLLMIYSTDYGCPHKWNFFIKIPNYWAWADMLYMFCNFKNPIYLGLGSDLGATPCWLLIIWLNQTSILSNSL